MQRSGIEVSIIKIGFAPIASKITPDVWFNGKGPFRPQRDYVDSALCHFNQNAYQCVARMKQRGIRDIEATNVRIPLHSIQATLL